MNGYTPWGGEMTPEEREDAAKRRAYLDDFKDALRFTPFILPYEIIDLICQQHEYYSCGSYEEASECFHEALGMFIQWRDSNYEPLNYDLYDNFGMGDQDNGDDLLAGFFGWTGDIVTG